MDWIAQITAYINFLVLKAIQNLDGNGGSSCFRVHVPLPTAGPGTLQKTFCDLLMFAFMCAFSCVCVCVCVRVCACVFSHLE